jgi:DNA-binding protein YbaB
MNKMMEYYKDQMLGVSEYIYEIVIENTDNGNIVRIEIHGRYEADMIVKGLIAINPNHLPEITKNDRVIVIQMQGDHINDLIEALEDVKASLTAQRETFTIDALIDSLTEILITDRT